MTYQSMANIPGLSPATAQAALAMVTVRTEEEYEVVGFSSRLVPLAITKTMSLQDVMNYVRKNEIAEHTNCGLPMEWAIKNKIPADAFVMFTDNEVNAGQHPSALLKDYRKKMNTPEAAMVVVGMTATNFTIADPKDARMMDVVGFDTAAPNIISDFIAQKF
jgi:60 kDa SS-A/Ro ribonucleoprotein